jgi:hypothetical protein
MLEGVIDVGGSNELGRIENRVLCAIKQRPRIGIRDVNSVIQYDLLCSRPLFFIHYHRLIDVCLICTQTGSPDVS